MSTVVYGSLAACFLFGVFLLYLGARNAWLGLASTDWPTVDGTIIGSDTEASRGSRGPSTAGASIVVKYHVNGRDYTTETRHFGQTLGLSDTSEAMLLQLRYPNGSVVRVAYDPSSPEVAVLEPGLDAELLWLPGAGLAFSLSAVMFTALYRSSLGSSSSGMAMGVALFAAIFMMIGLPMLIIGGINLYRSFASQSWPTTKGEIIYDEIDVSTSTRESGPAGRRVSRTTTTYGPRIIFRYEVNGKRHYSNTRRFGALSGSDAEWANEISDKYPEGYKLPVSYHPDDPNLAVIETGITPEAYWLPGAGAAFFLFGLAAAVFAAPAMARS